MSFIADVNKQGFNDRLLKANIFKVPRLKPVGVNHASFDCGFLQVEEKDSSSSKLINSVYSSEHVEVISLETILMREHSFCKECFLTMKLDIDSFYAPSLISNLKDFIDFFSVVETFLKSVDVNLDDGFKILQDLDGILPFNQDADLGNFYYREVVNKMRFAYPSTPESLKTFHGELLKHLSETSQKDCSVSKFVVFDSIHSVLNAGVISRRVETRSLLQIILLNPLFSFDELTVLPFVEYKFLEKFVLTEKVMLEKHVVVDEIFTESVKETFMVLKNAHDGSFNDFKTAFIVASTV